MGSVLIKGMEMPKSCDVCEYCNDDYICNNFVADCYGLDVSDYVRCRHDDCPLVEVPTPHGRLIDADALTGEQYKEGNLMVVEMDAIEDAPTIIEAEE